MNIQHYSISENLNLQDLHVNHATPTPLMSIVISPSDNLSKTFRHNRVSIKSPKDSSSRVTSSKNCEDMSSKYTCLNGFDASRFYFAHAIKVPHGTNILASNNQSTTVCINSVRNIIHCITPTGYYIRSTRLLEADNSIIDLLWCETLQVYLLVTCNSIFTLKYDSEETIILEKSLNISRTDSSSKVLTACNSYRLYIHNQSAAFIDVYTLHFAHLLTKQLRWDILQNQIDEITCSDSFVALRFKETPNRIIILNSVTMIHEYELDLSYSHISSLRCFINDSVLVFMAKRQDGDKRLVFLNFENKNKKERDQIQQAIIEKPLEYGDQLISLLPNSRDLMILNIPHGRVQYVKYRS